MNWKKGLAIGCGGCAVVVLVGVILFVLFAVHASKTPPDITVTIEKPTTVAVGEDFTVTVVIENHRSAKPFGLTDIDFDDKYINGFLVSGTEPPAQTSMHVPLVDRRSFTFGTPIPAGETARFAFHLRPTAAGRFEGDVNVCEGTPSITALVQTQVTEAGAAPAPAPSPTPAPGK